MTARLTAICCAISPGVIGPEMVTSRIMGAVGAWKALACCTLLPLHHRAVSCLSVYALHAGCSRHPSWRNDRCRHRPWACLDHDHGDLPGHCQAGAAAALALACASASARAGDTLARASSSASFYDELRLLTHRPHVFHGRSTRCSQSIQIIHRNLCALELHLGLFLLGRLSCRRSSATGSGSTTGSGLTSAQVFFDLGDGLDRRCRFNYRLDRRFHLGSSTGASGASVSAASRRT